MKTTDVSSEKLKRKKFQRQQTILGVTIVLITLCYDMSSKYVWVIYKKHETILNLLKM